jgi:hypothetical protein
MQVRATSPGLFSSPSTSHHAERLDDHARAVFDNDYQRAPATTNTAESNLSRVSSRARGDNHEAADLIRSILTNSLSGLVANRVSTASGF